MKLIHKFIGIKLLSNLKNIDSHLFIDDCMIKDITVRLIQHDIIWIPCQCQEFIFDVYSTAKTINQRLADYQKIFNLLRKNEYNEINMTIQLDRKSINATISITIKKEN